MSRRGLIWLVALIPASSICMGALILYLAFSGNNDLLTPETTPLSKTSWRAEAP